MHVYQIDPLIDRRWDALTCTHPNSSIFHTAGWLRALQLTYGYQPVAYTLSAPDSELMTAVVFCRVHTWPTGRRLVSLPFSDHCEPLTDDAEQLNEILSYIRAHRESDRIRHVEIRPVQINADLFQSGLQFGVHKTYYSHRVDLRLSCDDLMRSFHKDC